MTIKKEKMELTPTELKIQKIAYRVNKILNTYEKSELNYERANEVKLDLTRIENALSNIEATMECEFKNGMIYKED